MNSEGSYSGAPMRSTILFSSSKSWVTPTKPLCRILVTISSMAQFEGAQTWILRPGLSPFVSSIAISPVIVSVLPVPGGPYMSTILDILDFAIFATSSKMVI